MDRADGKAVAPSMLTPLGPSWEARIGGRPYLTSGSKLSSATCTFSSKVSVFNSAVARSAGDFVVSRHGWSAATAGDMELPRRTTATAPAAILTVPRIRNLRMDLL